MSCKKGQGSVERSFPRPTPPTNSHQCDQKVPRCSACTRQGDECNITECVFYPYSALETLQRRINDLEARLPGSAEGVNGAQPAVQPATDDRDASVGFVGLSDSAEAQHTSASFHKEAEEIGVLAIGGSDIYSRNKYGKPTFMFGAPEHSSVNSPRI